MNEQRTEEECWTAFWLKAVPLVYEARRKRAQEEGQA